MKAMIRNFSIFTLLIVITSCATTPLQIPEKYNLDNELEAVKQIYNYRVTSWERVDNQSVFLISNINDYYLLVLDRPLIELISSESIGISSTVSTIKAGFDKIYVKDSGGIEYYIIEKIYKLDGKDQAKQIKEQLREIKK